nr:MFS transporter [uncultured Holophaga sp.]
MDNPRTQKLWICTLTAFFWLAQYIYLPFLTPHLLSLGLSATRVGIIVGAYGLTQFLLRIPLGMLVDRVGHHPRFILGGALLAALSSLMLLRVASPGMLFLANALSGAGSATWISFLTLYASHHSPGEQTRALGVINAFYNLGILLAFLVGGMVITRQGIHALFLLSAGFGLLACLISLGLRGEGTQPRIRAEETGRGLLTRRLGLCSFLGAAVFLMLFATVFSFTNSTARALGATGGQLGLFAMLYCLGCVLGSFLLGTSWAQRTGEGCWLAQGCIVVGAYCALVPWMTHPAWLMPLQLACGLASGGVTSALMGFAVKGVSPDRRTTAMGVYQSINCLGTTLGPVLMGLLLDHIQTRPAFMAVGGLGLVCACLAFGMPGGRVRVGDPA